MAEETTFENGRISNFQGLVTLTLTLYLVSGYTAYRRTSLDLYLDAKFQKKLKKLFVDGRTYVRTDGHLRPTFLGRLRRVDLKSGYSCS